MTTPESSQPTAADAAAQAEESVAAASEETTEPDSDPEPEPTTEETEMATDTPAEEARVTTEVADEEVGACAICNNPIEEGQDFVEAAYGPVHAEPCSHMSRPA